MEGTLVDFNCRAIGGSAPPPRVQWFNGLAYLSFEGSVSSVFRFFPSRSNDRANITCRVEHPGLEEIVTKTVELYLTLKPTDPVMSEVRHTDIGSVIYQCETSEGRPAPEIRWLLDNTTFSAGVSNQVVFDSMTETYSVKSFATISSNTDGGTLTCYLHHPMASTLNNASTTLNQDIAIEFSIATHGAMPLLGSYSTTLLCSAQKQTDISLHTVVMEQDVGGVFRSVAQFSDRTIPKAEIDTNGPLSHRARASLTSNSTNMVASLKIYTMRCEDQTQYRCTYSYLTSSFTLKAARRTLPLAVGARPSGRPHVIQPTINFVAGQTMTATCNSEVGNPAGLYNWTLTRTDGSTLHVPSFTKIAPSSHKHRECSFVGVSTITHKVDVADNDAVLKCDIQQPKIGDTLAEPFHFTVRGGGTIDSGLHCKKCSDVRRPTHCNTIVDCNIGESCFTQEHSSGYSMGCASIETCDRLQSSTIPIGKRNTPVRTSALCYQCCQTSSCNSDLCPFK
ncbi:hypothetical protein ScPMuIL_002408 [Solemya velum]